MEMEFRVKGCKKLLSIKKIIFYRKDSSYDKSRKVRVVRIHRNSTSKKTEVGLKK